MKRSATHKEFKKLIKAYLNGSANEKQSKILEDYYEMFSEGPDILNSLKESEVQLAHDRIKNGINKFILQVDIRPVPFYKQYIFQFAAVFVMLLSVGIYIYLSSHEQITKKKLLAVHHIVPGSNKAILILSNGSRISLGDSTEKEIANESGTHIWQGSQGRLIYAGSSENNKIIQYNTISTSNGGQYQVVLSEGTKVWLNAASSLKYPVAFGKENRCVELTGEAYFEVNKDKARPFLVTSNLQQVEVLGTHFNITAYEDEKAVKTTLLQGSIKIIDLQNKSSKIIKPGQQSIVDSNLDKGITVEQVDVEDATAWKNGYFVFDKESLESVLKKISRWYDVDIEYESEDSKNQLFSGTLSKYSEISKVLRKLELTETVHFNIEGRSILVMK